MLHLRRHASVLWTPGFRVLLKCFWVDIFRFLDFRLQVDEAYARLPGSDVLDLGTEGARRWAEAREAYDRR